MKSVSSVETDIVKINLQRDSDGKGTSVVSSIERRGPAESPTPTTEAVQSAQPQARLAFVPPSVGAPADPYVQLVNSLLVSGGRPPAAQFDEQQAMLQLLQALQNEQYRAEIARTQEAQRALQQLMPMLATQDMQEQLAAQELLQSLAPLLDQDP